MVSNREKEFNFGKNAEELTKLKDCLIELSEKYGLGEIFFEEENYNQLNCFFIKAPKSGSMEKVRKIWRKIEKEAKEFAKKEDILPVYRITHIVVENYGIK